MNFKRLICLFFTFVFVFTVVPNSVHAAYSAKKTANLENVLKSGVYRIKNRKSGLYIDLYDMMYDAKGSAYLDERNGGEAQDIYVERLLDGTYILRPQSESGKYSVSFKGLISEGQILTKREAAEKTERFVIYSADEGYYSISPAIGSDSLTLGISDKKSRYDHNYISLCKYIGSADQQWAFEPIEPDGISLSFVSTTVKIYTVGTLYATLTPYNFGTDDIKWTSDNESVVLIDSKGNYTAFAPGKAKITAVSGDKSASCTITVSKDPAFTWYSQHSSTGSDWNASLLSNISFTAGGVRKRFMIDKYGKGKDWMDEGCYLASVAMVLNNMGARLTCGYDFRSGQSGNLPADPYTVALANSGNNGATTSRSVLYGNPILISRSNIDAGFNVHGKAIKSVMTYDVSPKAIKEALDEHPEGVIIYFSIPSRNRTHYIVFTKCINPTEKNPKNFKFEVCDSASYDAARGDHVPFERSISYTAEGYRMSNAVSMISWDIID